MKISDVKEGMSIKYEARSRKWHGDSYTLVGMFMLLPENYIDKKNGLQKQNTGIFIGYLKETNQLRVINAYLYSSANSVVDSKKNLLAGYSVAMSVDKMSATRLPKNVSDYLKFVQKQYKEEQHRQEEIKRLMLQSKQATKYIKSLTETIANKTIDEVTL